MSFRNQWAPYQLLDRGGVVVEPVQVFFTEFQAEEKRASSSRDSGCCPTPDFRRAAIQSRSVPGEGFVWKTSDPAKAGRNIAERDRLFTRRLEEDTERLQLHTIHIDTTMTEDDLAEQVTTAFGL
ncbi:hypothetical protein ACWEP4_39470 [Streptomyces sp. NPDC004227]